VASAQSVLAQSPKKSKCIDTAFLMISCDNATDPGPPEKRHDKLLSLDQFREEQIRLALSSNRTLTQWKYAGGDTVPNPLPFSISKADMLRMDMFDICTFDLSVEIGSKLALAGLAVTIKLAVWNDEPERGSLRIIELEDRHLEVSQAVPP
jgi:hypothetical protein